ISACGSRWCCRSMNATIRRRKRANEMNRQNWRRRFLRYRRGLSPALGGDLLKHEPLRAGVVRQEEQRDLEFRIADAKRLIPVNFRHSNGPVSQFDTATCPLPKPVRL